MARLTLVWISRFKQALTRPSWRSTRATETIAQDLFQPDFDCRGHLGRFGECELPCEAGCYVRREANTGSQRSGRTYFDPGSDNEEAGVVNRHTLD